MPLVAAVAQLVERQLPKLNVVGSSPISRSTQPFDAPMVRALLTFVRSC